MHGDCRVDEVAAQRPEPCQSPLFVGGGEPAEADHIGDAGRIVRTAQFVFASPSGSPALRRPSKMR